LASDPGIEPPHPNTDSAALTALNPFFKNAYLGLAD
jgi:hypothetical protein